MNTTPAYVAILNGDRIPCDPTNYNAACDELIRRHGGGVPQVILANPAPESVPAAAPVISVFAPTEAGRVDVIGAMRSMQDADTATATGFAPAMPLFARGTRVNETGVANAKQSRLDHDAKPTVAEYCCDFVQVIAAEQRRDVNVRTGALRMDKAGRLVVQETRDLINLTPKGLDCLTTRLGIGGAAYLRACKPELRAININHHARDLATAEDTANSMIAPTERTESISKLRIRNGKAGVELFGLVSDSYTSFDVDKIAEAIALASPEDARGTVTYDGSRARFEVVFHSDVQPEEYVVGEFFKAACIVETADDGTGSLKVSAAIWQNLCLNLIVIDKAEQYTARIRHVGSVQQLAAKFRAGFAAAIKKVEPFLKQWGYACQEDVAERALVAAGIDQPVPDAMLLSGLFNGIIERELVPVRMNGRKREDVVGLLVQKFDADDSSARRYPDGSERGITRAAIVNAFTRYAHEETQSSPWDEDEIQRAAGAILWPAGRATTPAPLPYIPFE